MDLGLLQKQVAEQIGVDKDTIHNWETKKYSPYLRFIPRIIQFLGYVPFPPAKTLPEKLIVYRKTLGLSREELAKTVGVDEGTLARWETGRSKLTKKCSEVIEAIFRPFWPPVSD